MSSIARTCSGRRLALALTLLLLAVAGGCQRQPLLRPNGVAIAPDGSLYVMDRGNYRIVHLNPDGRILDTIGQFGAGPGDVHSGWDIALDAQGNVYICNHVYSESSDLLNDGIAVFGPDGRFLRAVGVQDYSDGNTLRYRPYGIDFDAQDRLYVADINTNTVRVFDTEGRLLTVLFGQGGAADGELNAPNDVAVDDRRGLLYVADSFNSRVQQFTLRFTDDGQPTVTHRLSFGSYGAELGQMAYPLYLAVDEPSGTLYVADLANMRIQAFDTEGNVLRAFAPPDVAVWQVLGLAVGSDGAVYAADSFNNAVWAFQADGQLRSRIEAQP